MTRSGFAESVEAQLTFTCTEDRLYKFYSHHYKDGVKFKTLEGVEFRPCSETSVGPIKIG